MVSSPEFLLITGARQVGKSTACLRAVRRMQKAGLSVSGLSTTRTGPHDLEVTEIHTGETYPLTGPFGEQERAGNRHGAQDFRPLHFNMLPQAMARSERALHTAFPTEVLLLDEIGPLELKRKEGWFGAIDLLQREQYEVAIIVVRLELLGDLVSVLPGSWFRLLHITVANRDSVVEQLVSEALAACASRRELTGTSTRGLAQGEG
ncbi:MAG: nucleoside-triphosphatase [Anaerolineae bacterium]